MHRDMSKWCIKETAGFIACCGWNLGNGNGHRLGNKGLWGPCIRDWILSFSNSCCWGVFDQGRNESREDCNWSLQAIFSLPYLWYLSLIFSLRFLFFVMVQCLCSFSPFPPTPPKLAIPPGSHLHWWVLSSLPLRNLPFSFPTSTVVSLIFWYFSHSFPPLCPWELFWFCLSSHHFISGLMQYPPNQSQP